ncbi:MAG: hypothetical protein R2695_00500 [Acidimicrobiales bacterium]
MHTSHGLAGQPAPELAVDEWLANVDGTLNLADIEAPVVYLYCFQSWCPGCHSHGFPTMKAVHRSLPGERTRPPRGVRRRADGVRGHETNTAAAAVESVERHGLTDIALGHDSGHPRRPC